MRRWNLGGPFLRVAPLSSAVEPSNLHPDSSFNRSKPSTNFFMSKQPSKKNASKKKNATKKAAAKKTADSKAVSKATPVKKTASAPKRKPNVAKKAAAKKTAKPKKAVSPKPAAKKTAVRKTAANDAAGPDKTSKAKVSTNAKAAAAAAAEASEGGATASEEASVAPVSSPGGFTLDDVRSILERKGDVSVREEASEEADAKPKGKKASSAKAEREQKAGSSPKKAASQKKKAASASVADILGFNPAKSATPPDRDEANVPAKWKPFFNSLMRLRTQLKEALGERTEETIGANARESSGELSVNSADSGTQAFDRDVAISMVAGEQESLHEVEAALDRIFAGTYGLCEETGKPIKQDRLRAVPFTRFSLEGQTQYEKRGRRSGDSGGGVFANLSEASLGDDEA